jgi:cytochrome b subunit of formate dehydrogenase
MRADANAITEYMAVGEPMEVGPAGHGAVGRGERSGAGRREIVVRVRSEVDAELARVRATARLADRDRVGIAGYLALALAVGVNVYALALFREGYMVLWIVASLYFYMFYPLLPLARAVALVLLHRGPATAAPLPLPRELVRSVREARLLRFKRRLVAVGWNVFFLGAVSMTAGFFAIFSLDILFAVLAGLVLHRLADLTMILVVVQALGIILYYLQVYLLRPYSAEFAARMVERLRGRRRGISLLTRGAALGLAVFLVAILLVIALLLPGWTVDRVVPLTELQAVRFDFYVLVLLASQLVIMQAFHRWLSRAIARPVLAASERALVRERRALRLLARTRSPRRRLRRIDRAVSLLAEVRLYRVDPVRLTGLFMLFLLGSDFLSLLLLRDVRRMDPRLRLPGRREK